MQKLTSHLTPATRREHDRVDLSDQPLDAWLLADPGAREEDGHCVCQLLNLSHAGMCVHSEDLLETGQQYRSILDVSAMLGAAVEVAARIVRKRADAGFCYVGAVFVKSSVPWLGPDEEDKSPQAGEDNGRCE
ncbi:MAG: PilZ domain-containing protein [Acidobacteria bacterium]|nr:PilZ domain-containing protein [Acidobacteriota bacterium]